MSAPLPKDEIRTACHAVSAPSLSRLAELVQRYLDCGAAVLSVDHPLGSLRRDRGTGTEDSCSAVAFRPGGEIANVDLRMLTNPVAAGEMGMHFYAGLPLRDHQGRPIGMLAALDQHERTLAPEELQTLKLLAEAASDLYQTQRLGHAA